MRYFTREAANAALADVRPLAEEMTEHARALAAARARRASLHELIGGNGGDLTPSDLAAAQEDADREAAAVSRCVERIHALGAQVKDLERGLVDFPAVREGEEILLCWHVGEEEVAYWHRPEDGFGGREPL